MEDGTFWYHVEKRETKTEYDEFCEVYIHELSYYNREEIS